MTPASFDGTPSTAAGGTFEIAALPDRDVAGLALLALAGALAAAARGASSGPRELFATERGLGEAALVAGAIVVLACLAARIFRSRPGGWATAALGGAVLVVDGFGAARAVPSAVFLLASFAFLLLVTVDRPSSGCGLGAGVLLGVAALLDPRVLVLAPLCAAPLFDRRFPPPIRRALAGSIVLGLALALAAGGVRYAFRGDRPRPASGSAVPGNSFARSRGDRPTGSIPERPRQTAPASPGHLLGIAWRCVGIGLAVRAGFRARRPGIRALALAALALSFAIPARFPSSRASIRDPILALYAAAGLAGVGKAP